MIRLTKCYSYNKARKMDQRRKLIRTAKARVTDWLYIGIVLFIIGSFAARFDIQITPKGAFEALAEAPRTITKEIVKEKLVAVPQSDTRADKLRIFLQNEHSPLAPYASLIVEEADRYDIGWTKLVSISCMESACGTVLPDTSHNAWGLGGSQFMYFDSWEDSIRFASKLLGEQYKTSEYQAIKLKYCPQSDGCNPKWATIVSDKSNEILALERGVR